MYIQYSRVDDECVNVPFECSVDFYDLRGMHSAHELRINAIVIFCTRSFFISCSFEISWNMDIGP
jgi:hypothetical protein